MCQNLQKYGQYKKDVFEKINFNFEKGKRLLDVGCGDSSDAKIFIKEFKLKTYGIDIYEHENVKKLKGFKFKRASIQKIPYPNAFFDYVFLHDVLHHSDKDQSYEKHISALKELRRVCKKNGYIIIIEANRYNPLFYPHMVILEGHNHFKQSYFRKIILDVFGEKVLFKTFEAHSYPPKLIGFFKIFEFISEKIPICKAFRAYNLAIVKKIDFQ